jgi:hypothetical protein
VSHPPTGGVTRVWISLTEAYNGIHKRIDIENRVQCCCCQSCNVFNRKDMCITRLSAMILTKMKAIAETYLGETITDAVITVPA